MKKLIIVLLTSTMCLLTGCQKQSSKTIEKIYTFYANAPDSQKEFEKYIEIDGVLYELVYLDAIKYEVLEEKEVFQQLVDVQIASKEEINETANFVINNQEYELTLVDQVLNEKQLTFHKVIEIAYQDIVGELTKDDVVASVPFVAYIDKQKQQLEASLVEIRQVSDEHWVTGFYIKARFIGDEDTKYFKVDSMNEITLDSKSPCWPNYEKSILKMNGLNENDYRIVKAEWLDLYQKQKDGKYVRNARYTYDKKVKDYVAVYVCDYPSLGYQGQLVYQIDADLVKEKVKTVTSYKIQATVKYERVK